MAAPVIRVCWFKSRVQKQHQMGERATLLPVASLRKPPQKKRWRAEMVKMYFHSKWFKKTKSEDKAKREGDTTAHQASSAS